MSKALIKGLIKDSGNGEVEVEKPVRIEGMKLKYVSKDPREQMKENLRVAVNNRKGIILNTPAKEAPLKEVNFQSNLQ